jgi:hypothetical protein
MFKPEKIQAYLTHISQHHSPVEDTLKRNIFNYGLWLLGIPAILFGAIDRGVAAFSSAGINPTDVSYCLISLVLLLAWICIGGADTSPNLSESGVETDWMPDQSLLPTSNCIAQQSYRLPFPYLCQIYHLLNLKHLEDIHRFSLGNLKVLKISHFQKTQAGGRVRFKTVLDSPFNILRLWREPSVDVDLTIHSPHQIELKVPVYQQKCIHVLFSVVPISAEEHQFSVHMFTDLQWPREFLKAIMLIAASLTLLEDLPYLQSLAKRNYGGLTRHTQERKHPPQAMQLFQRYVDLYSGQHEYQQLQLFDSSGSNHLA